MMNWLFREMNWSFLLMAFVSSVLTELVSYHWDQLVSWARNIRQAPDVIWVHWHWFKHRQANLRRAPNDLWDRWHWYNGYRKCKYAKDDRVFITEV